jgi:hypothetical protein
MGLLKGGVEKSVLVRAPLLAAFSWQQPAQSEATVCSTIQVGTRVRH